MAEKPAVNTPVDAIDAADRAYGIGSTEEYERLRATLAAAAPLIVAAELEKILAGCWDYPYEQWTTMVADRATKRLAELRGGS